MLWCYICSVCTFKDSHAKRIASSSSSSSILMSFWFFFADKPHRQRFVCADDKLFFAHLSRYPLICMSEFLFRKKPPLIIHSKSATTCFSLFQDCFIMRADVHARQCVHHTCALRGDRGGWGKLFAFQVIRKGENTCVMSFPPSPPAHNKPGSSRLAEHLATSCFDCEWSRGGCVRWMGWKRIARCLGSAPRCERRPY